MQHTAIDGTAKKRRAALWALCTALAVLCAVAVTYYWRVFYAYTAVPAVPLALCAAALALCGAVAVGNEGHGLSGEMLDLCDKLVVIPMKGQTESLSAPCAAAILLWELWGRRDAGC